MEISLLIMVLFWGIVFGFIIWLVFRLTRQNAPANSGQRNLLDIARERYVRGEINKNQFEQLKKDLA